MSTHTNFEVHLTTHPDTARVITGLNEDDARAIADAAERAVVVERVLPLDEVDQLSE